MRGRVAELTPGIAVMGSMDLETGAAIVGLIAVLYGVGVAFGTRSLSAAAKKTFVLGGAVVLLLLALILLGPHLQGLLS